jgi:hypothetical protein
MADSAVGWWRRRESNPRPQALCLRLYMLIRVYLFNCGLPDGQGSPTASPVCFNGAVPDKRPRDPASDDA